MKLTTFTNAPIDEVVCSVHFSSEKPLRTVDLGLFWQSIQTDFPNVTDQPPLRTIHQSAPGEELSIDIPTLPPIRRIWFEKADNTRLIQIQAGQFHYNWRRRQPDQEYPRYETVITEFMETWSRFQNWCKTNNPGHLQATNYELSYINHISASNGLTTPERCHELLKYMYSVKSSCLPDLHWFSHDLVFRMPQERGQLVVSTRLGQRNPDLTPVVTVRLTAQGYNRSESLTDWFAEARSMIVGGFTDLTTVHAHEIWGLQHDL